MQKNEIGSLSPNRQKINSKCINDLNVRLKTIKILKENVKRKLLDLGLDIGFLNLTPKAQATISKINKWDYIKLKSYVEQRKQSTKQTDNQQFERNYL